MSSFQQRKKRRLADIKNIEELDKKTSSSLLNTLSSLNEDVCDIGQKVNKLEDIDRSTRTLHTDLLNVKTELSEMHTELLNIKTEMNTELLNVKSEIDNTTKTIQAELVKVKSELLSDIRNLIRIESEEIIEKEIDTKMKSMKIWPFITRRPCQ